MKNTTPRSMIEVLKNLESKIYNKSHNSHVKLDIALLKAQLLTIEDNINKGDLDLAYKVMNPKLFNNDDCNVINLEDVKSNSGNFGNVA